MNKKIKELQDYILSAKIFNNNSKKLIKNNNLIKEFKNENI